MRVFLRFLVRNIPRPWLIRMSYLFSHLIIIFYKGNKVYCPVCESRFRKFLPFGNAGAENRLCPKCLSLERHRLLWMFLKNKTDFFSAPRKVLHIAPEQAFLKRFKKMPNLNYLTADLESPIADVHMDIQQMPFKNDEFDLVMANHVLEHIPDEPKAIREVFRVLKSGGMAIMLVPIDPARKVTYEDPTITDAREREKHFGQYDHLRYHGLDYPDRLTAAGFRVSTDRLYYELEPEIREKYRLFKPGEELIYVATKP
jgi:SAM-dependent methyltransferase